jgi:signal transduction histidine kinase
MRERAELLGGRFSVETAPGRGTTITVSLPLA